MMRKNSEQAPCFYPAGVIFLAVFWWQIFCCGALFAADAEKVQSAPAPGSIVGNESGFSSSYNVKAYVIEGKQLPWGNNPGPLLSKYTGTNVSPTEIMHAAADLEREFKREGSPNICISVAPNRIANGIVTLNVFQGAVSQIMISGNRFLVATNGLEAVLSPPAAVAKQTVAAPSAGASVPASSNAVAKPVPMKPATPEQIAQARAALFRELAKIETEVPDTRIHVVSTNAGPRFDVEHYLILGNSLLSPETIAATLTNIDGDFGTNVSFAGVKAAVEQLHEAYYDRGYLTVAVGLPPQKLTNATVKVQVMEGRLVAIDVEGNQYFSSNNVMRALPSLHTNMILNNYVFQRELDVANSSRDRTIYPVVAPGPYPGTTALTLRVKDQFPLHARTEINNSYTPGTPDLRINSSIQYDNLWDREHQIGFSYNFSPNGYKNAPIYGLPFFNEPFIDAPEIDNYSVYYRIPLGDYVSVQQQLDQSPSSFGYSEVSHKFSLPPATGRPELTIYGSRATTDTGVQLGPISLETNPTNNLEAIGQQTAEENVTLNEGFGGKLTLPLPANQNVTSILSLGFDFKHYESRSASANLLYNLEVATNNSQPIKYGLADITLQPVSQVVLNYLPFNVGWNGSVSDPYGITALNAQANFNLFTGTGLSNNKQFGAASYTTNARAQYVTIQMGVSRDQQIYQGWGVSLHADGQWASGALFNNEQYGIGGTAGVRGYLDGQDYGDDGWRMSLEPHTPSMMIGMVNGNQPFSVREAAFLDYGGVIRLDNSDGSYDHRFLGVGFGITGNIGSHWDGRLTLAWPLLDDGGAPGDSVHVYFGVGGQF